MNIHDGRTQVANGHGQGRNLQRTRAGIPPERTVIRPGDDVNGHRPGQRKAGGLLPSGSVSNGEYQRTAPLKGVLSLIPGLAAPDAEHKNQTDRGRGKQGGNGPDGGMTEQEIDPGELERLRELIARREKEEEDDDRR